MRFEIKYPPGATPLSKEEAEGLLPSDLGTHGDLNSAEQANIVRGEFWAFKTKKTKDLLSEATLKKLHKEMFGDVWKWAGMYRKSDKSVGDVHWPMVGTEIHKLLQNVAYWIEHTTYGWEELGARLHHKLVWIHPFPNGNGRHARLFTDLVLYNHGQERFSWGSNSQKGTLRHESEIRSKYIEALREADVRKIAPLIQFVRS